MRQLIFAVAGVCSTFAVVSSVRGGVILPNLPVGSQYQLTFVTAGSRDAMSTNIEDYNQFVTEQAALNPALPQGLTWRAIASTATVDARCSGIRFNTDL